jgi:hypothetical protein
MTKSCILQKLAYGSYEVFLCRRRHVSADIDPLTGINPTFQILTHCSSKHSWILMFMYRLSAVDVHLSNVKLNRRLFCR